MFPHVITGDSASQKQSQYSKVSRKYNKWYFDWFKIKINLINFVQNLSRIMIIFLDFFFIID